DAAGLFPEAGSGPPPGGPSSLIRQDHVTVVREDPVRGVSDLPRVAVRGEEPPRVPAPERRCGLLGDPCARCGRLGQDHIDLRFACHVVGEAHAAKAAPELEAVVGSDVRTIPQSHDHASGLEEGDVDLGRAVAAPAERFIEATGTREIRDSEREDCEALLHGGPVSGWALSPHGAPRRAHGQRHRGPRGRRTPAAAPRSALGACARAARRSRPAAARPDADDPPRSAPPDRPPSRRRSRPRATGRSERGQAHRERAAPAWMSFWGRTCVRKLRVAADGSAANVCTYRSWRGDLALRSRSSAYAAAMSVADGPPIRRRADRFASPGRAFVRRLELDWRDGCYA